MICNDLFCIFVVLIGIMFNVKSWLIEVLLCMLMNNLYLDVVECLQELVVYGGIGWVVCDWESFDVIVEMFKCLDDDQILLVQLGKLVGVFCIYVDVLCVLIVNFNLVLCWVNWDYFNELDKKGLVMYGQMIVGSWIYIGVQGIVQGIYEIFVEMGCQYFGGDLIGKWLFIGGFGGMGGVQLLVVVMVGVFCLVVECCKSSIDMCLCIGYFDIWIDNLDEVLCLIDELCKVGMLKLVGLLGNVVDVLVELFKCGVKLDLLIDQIFVYDLVNGYLLQGWMVEQWDEKCVSVLKEVEKVVCVLMVNYICVMFGFYVLGVLIVDYGNNLWQMVLEEGVVNVFDFFGFVLVYICLLFCRGIGFFCWVVLSGDLEDIVRIDVKVKELILDNLYLYCWLDMVVEKIKFQGLLVCICWVGLGDCD